jgi:hypothetical protein
MRLLAMRLVSLPPSFSLSLPLSLSLIPAATLQTLACSEAMTKKEEGRGRSLRPVPLGPPSRNIFSLQCHRSARTWATGWGHSPTGDVKQSPTPHPFTLGTLDPRPVLLTVEAEAEQGARQEGVAVNVVVVAATREGEGSNYRMCVRVARHDAAQTPQE